MADFLFTLSRCLSALAIVLKMAYNKLRKRHSLVKFVNVKRIEIVLSEVAHPDNECMFFGPAVRMLDELGCNLHVYIS